MIEQRISRLSCSETIFHQEAQIYQNALQLAGYKDKITYNKDTTHSDETKKIRKRRRNILWYNPPYSENVKTNIGRRFLNLIDKHFGNSYLKRYFNRKTIKISYSCMPNMDSIISSHKKRLLHENEKPKIKDIDRNHKCNCQFDTESCPLYA